MKRRLFIQQAIAASLWAQETKPDIAAVEKELRDRAQHFYELQRDKKYREAEAMVADDTKDFYYAEKKADIRDFSIGAIQLLDNGTQARVTVKFKVVALMPGVGAQTFEMPSSTEWKIEKGEWRWCVSEESKLVSPFGKLKPGAGDALDGKSKLPEEALRPDLKDLLKKVTIDRTSVEFTAASPEQEVTITNGLPGPLDVRVDAGSTLLTLVTVKIQKKHLLAGEKTAVTFRRMAEAPVADSVSIVAEQINKIFTVRLSGK